jgi:hypothetical protein
VATKREIETVKGYAKWLTKVPWQLFATYTFAWAVTDRHADEVFCAYIDTLERALRSPVAYVRGDEKRFSGCGKPASPRHYHALLASHVHLDPDQVKRLWWQFGGRGHEKDSADARCYDPSGPAAQYCLKLIHAPDGDWKFGNLDLFMPGLESEAQNKRARRRATRNQARTSEKE